MAKGVQQIGLHLWRNGRGRRAYRPPAMGLFLWQVRQRERYWRQRQPDPKPVAPANLDDDVPF